MTESSSITESCSMSPSSTSVSSSADRFCHAIGAATLRTADAFCPDVILDATVPNWHFVRRGRDVVRDQPSYWFADPGRFDSLRRTPLPDGELVEFELGWVEDGVPHVCRQVHVLELRDERIARDTVWGGG